MKGQDYDNRLAIFLAAVCGQTYTQFSNKDGSFVVPKGYELVTGFKGVAFYGIEEWFGYIIESDERIIIAFRGTSSSADWMANAMARQVKYKFVSDAGWTHKGFTQIYSSLRDDVIGALKRLPARKTMFLTGHSLGGALATLCALDVAHNTKFNSPIIYTFGSPRVGNPDFARALSRKISHRVANKYDLVPHLPPLLFKVPEDDTIYYYMHVKELHQLEFQDDSITANHIIADYFKDLSSSDSAYSQHMCTNNPGFCPEP
ncbi:lipase family protein [Paenibacillus cremeus]|uniref:Lipase family protein n=1 Tax=Paenibacillus cremeus TaxID=2163881 RepID=A0A559JVW4_9BACL|nr:lipase family protein [Paenibacillus cremeus]TVY04008.1 lipase family protein [Paenibacillus cremeus]